MKTNIVIDISVPIPYLAKFWFSSNGQNAVGQPNPLKCNILINK